MLIAAASDLSPLAVPLTAAARQALGLPVQFTFASSGVLARQIENGAQYDVFLSANEKFVRDLLFQKKVDGPSVQVFALGRLALWSKSGQVTDVVQLLQPSTRHVAIANPQVAPYGFAARQFLTNRQLWPAIQPKVVYAENVRQAFQFAESGNADAAIVSWTLAKGRSGMLLPDRFHDPIRQTAAVVSASRRRTDALAFLRFLLDPQGQALLQQHGLFPVGR